MGQTKLSALPQSPPDAQAIAVSWLATFSKSLEAGDVDGVISTFFPDGYLRDILIFTWNNRTAKGHTAIRAFLASSLHAAHITNVVLDERQYFNPVYGAIGPSVSGVSTGFTFETPIAKGQGYAKLAEDENGEWKALSVFFMMDELKGHGDLYPESGVYGGHTRAYDIHVIRSLSERRFPHKLLGAWSKSRDNGKLRAIPMLSSVRPMWSLLDIYEIVGLMLSVYSRRGPDRSKHRRTVEASRNTDIDY